jgi:hypothetical protein
VRRTTGWVLLWVLLVALFLAVGPWSLLVVPVLVVLVLLVPSVRRTARPRHPWRATVVVLVVAAALVGAVLAVPRGRLPIPPGAGALVTPTYVGSPATPRPVQLEIPQHPFLAPNGRSSMHDDGWATDAYRGPGPLGRSPRVDTAWYGLEECATLAFDRTGRIVALCGDLRGPVLHVLDPETMRPLATLRLPDRPEVEGKKPWENLCAGAYFYLDRRDRAVVATTDRRVLEVSTSDANGQPRLRVERSFDVAGEVPRADCLVALMPDWSGLTWFVTQDGRVGTVDPGTGRVAARDLGEEVANSLAVDEGGVYAVTVRALYRLRAGAHGVPEVAWRTTYDRGSRTKPGQLSRGSGTTPTVLPGGVVAITDNADPRMHVVFHDTATGRRVCQAPVFARGRSATENSLVSVGDGVIVENNHGYSGPASTLLGRTTTPGLARVDLADGRCSVAWTSAEIAPTSVPKASLANGLVYAYTKRPTLWGVAAWYLTAIDVRTGRTAFSVRTGLGALMNNHYAAVTLAPDGSAYVATLAGMVRVRDSGGNSG